MSPAQVSLSGAVVVPCPGCGRAVTFAGDVAAAGPSLPCRQGLLW
jgi:hypothetical protein